MKEFKVNIPEGMELDEENTKIVFKKIEKELPKKWEDLEELKGYVVTINAKVVKNSFNLNNSLDSNIPCLKEYHKSIFPTKEAAEASIALA